MSTAPESFQPDAIRERVASHRPTVFRADTPWQAATAVVIAPGDPAPCGAAGSRPEPDAAAGPTAEHDRLLAAAPVVASIRRAERRGDRFSGDMALPGGVREPHDADLAATAVRETWEEVGVRLPPPVGRLDDHRGRTRRGLVASFVFLLDHRPPLTPEPAEVAEALWIPLPWLFDQAGATTMRWAGIPFPAVDYEGRIIWGLTHRIIRVLGTVLDVAGPSGRLSR